MRNEKKEKKPQKKKICEKIKAPYQQPGFSEHPPANNHTITKTYKKKNKIKLKCWIWNDCSETNVIKIAKHVKKKKKWKFLIK